mgnify:CR=1 FL=1
MAMEQAVANTVYNKKQKAAPVSASGSIPLSMVPAGRSVLVQSIRGKDETRRFLESLGFVENAEVCVVSELGGNVIVNVKDTRVAISRAMAARIYAV